VSEENVEIVREVIARLEQAEPNDLPTRLIDLCSSDVEIVMTRRRFNPDTYHVHAGMQRLVREVGEVWEEFHLIPQRFVDAGDRVVVIATRRGVGRTSGVEISDRTGVIWTSSEAACSTWNLTWTPTKPSKPWGWRRRRCPPTSLWCARSAQD
jgi:hypothetical protein